MQVISSKEDKDPRDIPVLQIFRVRPLMEPARDARELYDSKGYEKALAFADLVLDPPNGLKPATVEYWQEVLRHLRLIEAIEKNKIGVTGAVEVNAFEKLLEEPEIPHLMPELALPMDSTKAVLLMNEWI